MTMKRARRARAQIDPAVLAWFRDKAPVPNHLKYFADADELLELWAHRAQMSPKAEAIFRTIASGAGLDLSVEG